MAKNKEKLSLKEATLYNERRKQDTGSPLADKVYNWIIDRYSKHGNKFETSDVVVWKGSVYELPEIFGYIIFFTIFLILANISFKKYGDARTIVFFMLLIMWRLQKAIGVLKSINKKL